MPDAARLLAKSFWPGPLTIIVARNPERIVPAVTGGRDTVGLRMPDHPLARRLLESFGGGVAAPSANRFGRVSPTTAAHVRADLGDDVRVVLDGGACRVGVESTIVDVTGREPAILRVGGVSRAEIERALGSDCVLRTAGEAAAPGTLASHYAPRAEVEVVDAGAVGERARARIAAGKEPACSRSVGSCPRHSTGWSCSTRRATSRTTRASCTRGSAKPMTWSSMFCWW